MHQSGSAKRPIVSNDCPLTPKDLRDIKVVRQNMVAHGYRPLAVHAPWSLACAQEVAGKAPIGKGWEKGHPNFRLFGNHPHWSRAGSNTGLLLGSGSALVQAIDLDIDSVAVMNVVLDTIKPYVPPPALIRYRSKSARLAILIGSEAPALKRKVEGELGAVERLATGQQIVVHGTHPSGAALSWFRDRSPWTVEATALPMMDETSVNAMFQALIESRALGSKIDRSGVGTANHGTAGPHRDIAREFHSYVERHGGIVPGARQFLLAVGARGTGRHDTLVSLAGVLIHRGWPAEEATAFLTEHADAAFGDGSWAAEVEKAVAHAMNRRAALDGFIRRDQ